MRILFINPPSPFLINQKASPPLGVLYLAAVLRLSSHHADFIDLSALPEAEWSIPQGYDFYGVTSATPQYPHARRILPLIKLLGRTIVGGPHASSLPPEVLNDGWDYVVVGEGESYPVSEALSRKGLYLPSGTGLSDNDIRYVCQTIREVKKGVGG